MLPRQERLLDILANYNFDISYVPGPKNGGPDGISRLAELAAPPPLIVTTPSENNAIECEVSKEILDSCKDNYSEVPFFKRIIDRLAAQKVRRTSHVWTFNNGLLWYHDVAGSAPRLGVPTVDLQLVLMKEAHDSITSNHQGIAATMELLQATYFWPHMAQQISTFVRECQLCQRAREAPNLIPGYLQPVEISTARWDAISMDFVTKLPKTSKGYTSIFTVVDTLTKRVRLLPTYDEASAEDIAKLFFDFIVSQFGLPRSIISDRDPKFTGEFWIHLMKLLGTTLRMSTSDHPQSDGQTERMHRTINARLRTLINHSQDDWDDKLSSIEFQMNSAKNESTGFSPFMLDIGRNPRSPLSALVTELQRDYTTTTITPTKLKIINVTFINKLRSTLIEARDNPGVSAECCKRSPTR